jgi:hypothetical protein
MATYNFNEVPAQLQKPANLEFKLENDGDYMVVRFLLGDDQSFVGESVHQVLHEKWYQTVSCNQEAGQTKDDCPLCAIGCPAREHYCLPVYVISKTTNHGGQTVDVNNSFYFVRGKTFRPMMESILRQCEGKAPVCSIFRITRNGAPRDPKTVYIVEKVSTDNAKLSDFPELPPALGTKLIKKITNTEMLSYCDSWKIQQQNEAAKRANNNAQGGQYMPQYQQQANTPYQAPTYQAPYQAPTYSQPQYQQPAPQYQPPQYPQNNQVEYTPPTNTDGGFGSSPNIGL